MRARSSILLALVLATVPVATAASSPAGPVTNSGFEQPPARERLAETTAGTPADRCYGIGHQVLFAAQSPQGQATGGPFGEPDPGRADPQGAAAGVAEDPKGSAETQLACDFSRQHGTDVAFVQPHTWLVRPTAWITAPEDPSTAFVTDADEDPTDREAKILTDGASHNLWQGFSSKHQAWTPNAEALSLRVEAGAISDHASVRLTLTLSSPDGDDPSVHDVCRLVFDADQLQAALAATDDDRLRADPTQADFDAAHPSCEDLEDAWTSATSEEAKRAVLAQTRITELSFWNWNLETSEPTVIDDVRLPGASLAAEEAGRQVPS